MSGSKKHNEGMVKVNKEMGFAERLFLVPTEFISEALPHSSIGNLVIHTLKWLWTPQNGLKFLE